MIYLERGILKPLVVFISIFFVPIIICVSIFLFSNYSLRDLIILLVVASSYASIIFLIYKLSQSKKYYLIAEDDCLRINYPNISPDHELKIPYEKIIYLKYYRITSLKAWAYMFLYEISPQCVFIIYAHEGEQKEIMIGYPKYDELYEICNKKGLKLTVKK